MSLCTEHNNPIGHCIDCAGRAAFALRRTRRVATSTAAPTRATALPPAPDSYAPGLAARAAQAKPNPYDALREAEAARDAAQPARTPAARSATDLEIYMNPPNGYDLALQNRKEAR